jgi:thymidylate synthase
MKTYLNLLSDILENGNKRIDRTGTGTYSLFGYQYRHDLQDGASFPLLTTKKVHFHSVLHELLWFIKGESNIQYLKENKVSIWDEWATENGELGPVYGVQWRAWKGNDGNTIDQLAQLVEGLKNKPFSRRHILNAWNVADLADENLSPQENVLQGKMALPPCHVMYQFYVSEQQGEKYLSCMLTQRSGDVFLGVPFNLASVSVLTIMLARICGYKAKEVIHSLGDVHLYSNHLEQAKIQLTRTPTTLPQLHVALLNSIDDYQAHHFELIDYYPQAGIKAPIAV